MMGECKKILLLGAGGHCLSVLDSLLSSYDYQDIGIVDKKIESNKQSNTKSTMLGFTIIGDDDELELLYNKGYKEAFIAVGSIGDVTLRKMLYKKVKEIGFKIPNIIDKTSVVSSNTSFGEGVYVGKKAVINADTKIGNLTIINTSAVVEHECEIKDFVHIAPGSILCGNVHIGNETHIGAGSIIKQGVHIGTKTMIGIGSVVLKNIEDNTVAFGNPCREENHE